MRHSVTARIVVALSALAVVSFVTLPIALAAGVGGSGPGVTVAGPGATLSNPVTVAQGGTGATSLTGSGVLVTNAGGTAVTSVAPSTSGNVLTSNGTTWVSSAPSTGSLLEYPSHYYAPTAIAVATVLAIGLPVVTESLSGGASAGSVISGLAANNYTSIATANADMYIASSVQVVRRPVTTTPEASAVVASSYLFTSTLESERLWAVAASSTVTLSDNDSVAAAHYCGIRYSSGAGDTSWQCCSADGTTASCSSLGARTDNVARRFEVRLSFTSCICRQIDASGALLQSVTKTTNLPDTGQNLYLMSSLSPLAADAVNYRIVYLGYGI
jgi:hypothetical protein